MSRAPRKIVRRQTHQFGCVETINHEWLRWRRAEYSRVGLREMAHLMGVSAPYLCDVEYGRRNVTEKVIVWYSALKPAEKLR